MSLADHDSPDVRHLWAAVCARPEEDTPRLELADALQEHGDDDRAAFVRAQVMGPQAVNPALQERAAVRAAQLLRAHEAAWLVAEWRYRVDWSRGFPSAVYAPLQDVFTRVNWPNNAGTWVPTPRALAWVREWGTVERVVLTCRIPIQTHHDRWRWWLAGPGSENQVNPAYLPPILYSRALEAARDQEAFNHEAYRTEAEAVDALARAVVRVLRAALKQQEAS